MNRRFVWLSALALAAGASALPAPYSAFFNAYGVGSAQEQQGRGGRGGAGGPGGGARGGAAAAPQNLQVLPKDMTQAQVLQAMQEFTTGLGVQCGYCHVQAAAPEGGRGGGGGARGRGGPAAPAFDFPSDEKPQKKAARQMILMVRDINPKVVTAVSKTEATATHVGCVTCHRGVAIPKQLAEILDQTAAEKGLDAALTQYKGLRKQYFGAQAYDFSEGSLVTIAQRATQAKKPDEAIAWLNLNLEYFPLSSRTYAGLSAAQVAKGEKDAGIKSQEKAVELDPQNAALKRTLDQLKGVPPQEGGRGRGQQ